jgi:hypothetical protein
MTQNYQVCPRPILRQPPRKSHQTTLFPTPQPPTQHREPPQPVGGKMSRTARPVRDKLPLRQCVDYDKLTPSEQARWDEGMYGAFSLKEDRGTQYYVLRWTDPRNGARRSNALGKDYKTAIARWKKLVLG